MKKKNKHRKNCLNCGRISIDDDACMDCMVNNYNRWVKPMSPPTGERTDEKG